MGGFGGTCRPTRRRRRKRRATGGDGTKQAKNGAAQGDDEALMPNEGEGARRGQNVRDQ